MGLPGPWDVDDPYRMPLRKDEPHQQQPSVASASTIRPFPDFSSIVVFFATASGFLLVSHLDCSKHPIYMYIYTVKIYTNNTLYIPTVIQYTYKHTYIHTDRQTDQTRPYHTP